MRTCRQNGFVLFVVIIFLMLLGFFMAVLTSHLKNLSYETNAERLKVYNQNLISSALAWANCNKHRLAEKNGQTIDLDVTQLGINGSKASITVEAVDQDKIKIKLTAQCQRARLILKKTQHAEIKKSPIKEKPN